MGLRQKWYEAQRRAEGLEEPPQDAPVTRGRFLVEVDQNHSTAGLGTMSNMKWRWSVVDSVTSRSQANGYDFTRRGAEAQANTLVSKIVKGKRPVR